ncbi:MAG TPA: MBOAT family O-acyltransferase [Ardenticatenaceae bacterium]|jgi:D-alanyl-lipoteichoic acid acyltransferase DltB (MBOAT superfamily)
MTFNSLHFLLFFPAVVVGYFALPFRYRWLFLLAASYYFYMSWRAEYGLLLFASTLVAYGTGLLMGRTPDPRKRRVYLLVSLISNLGVLFGFKYLDFFNESLRGLFNQFNIFYDVPAFQVLLPVGISFYTFQALSYSIDVYRGRKTPETHLGIFALYLSFFPQLVAGPIERSAHLLPQFHEKHDFDDQRVTAGLRRMAWGFFKKLVIADRLALYVNTVYNSPTDYTGLPLIVATYLFLWQLYCDFSAYSDIAIGAAQVMGFDLMENFRRPFFARSIGEFWQRWHISLTTWFRDYVYIPLARRRRFRWHPSLDFFILFVLIGLWHGANWTFIIFGLLHGFYMAWGIWTQGTRANLSRLAALKSYPRVTTLLEVFVTFHLLAFSIIFFRANSLSDALYIVSHLFAGLEWVPPYQIALGAYEFAVAILAIAILELVHFVQERGLPQMNLSRHPVWVRWSAYYLLLFGILIFGQFGRTEFIYFRF